MLPYLAPPTIGPITSFGILAMLGLLFAEAACTRHAQKLGLEPARARWMLTCCAIGGVGGGHFFDLVLYQPGWSSQPDALWRFFNPFSGLSSWGGLIGGTLAFLLFARKTGRLRLRFADAALVGVVVFLVFGRAGCASVHDHVGVATSFPLAIDFPPGNAEGVVGPHHDLGLYDFALFAALCATMVVLLRTPRRPGWIVGVIAIGYAVPRFFLEFLRRESTDPHYAALTPAQWSCMAAVAVAIGLLVWVQRRGEPPPERYLAATSWRTHLRGFLRLRSS